MTGSHSSHGGKGGGFLAGLGRLLFCGAAYKGINVGAGALASSIAGTTFGGPVGGLILGAGYVLSYKFIHHFCEPHHPSPVPRDDPDTLNHDLQRATACAAALTFSHLIHRWQNHHSPERRVEIPGEALLAFGKQCKESAHKLTAQPGEKLSNLAMQVITEWNELLDSRAVEALSGIVPDTELTEGLTLRAVEAVLQAQDKPHFVAYFTKRFHATFDAFFWNEVKTDSRAGFAFFAGLHKHSLSLQTQTLADTETLKTQLAQLIQALDPANSGSADARANLLSAIERDRDAELQKIGEDFCASVKKAIGEQLAAVQKAINEHTTAVGDSVVARVTDVIRPVIDEKNEHIKGRLSKDRRLLEEERRSLSEADKHWALSQQNLSTAKTNEAMARDESNKREKKTQEMQKELQDEQRELEQWKGRLTSALNAQRLANENIARFHDERQRAEKAVEALEKGIEEAEKVLANPQPSLRP